MKAMLNAAQQLGRALMLPIAVLPVAALFLRLGQPDVIGLVPLLEPIGPPIAAAGNAIFANLGVLFAVGVAVGLARENHGAAGLAALVCYLVITEGAKLIIDVDPAAVADLTGRAAALAAEASKARQLSRLSVPAGIVSGILAGFLYNRYYDIQLPSYLAFFGGRRFVPIVSGLAGLVGAFLFGHGFPLLQHGMDVLSRSVVSAGGFGLFIYGVLNRVLIVTGLHHIINNVAWQLLGDYHGTTGDLNRFFKGDPTAGAFMSGFFPVMMFGLPAACLAMYRAAKPERRKAVAGMLASMALTSFLTGITEPIEFTFMFLAPVLYCVHAILTGIAMTLMNFLGIRLGFGFSAGFIDYALNYGLATRPLWLLPIGALYFAVYYTVFRACITAFNLQTPGREPIEAEISTIPANTPRAVAFITALGGPSNLTSVDACATRLRLMVNNQAVINEPALKQLGARATVRVSANALQVVLGPIADQIADEIRTHLRTTPTTATVTPTLLTDLITALGGRENIRDIEAVATTRLRIHLANPTALNEPALSALSLRGIARPAIDRVHILLGPGATEAVTMLRALVG